MFRSSWTPNTGQSSSSVYFLPVVFHAGTILCNCTVVFHAGTISVVHIRRHSKMAP